MRRRRFRPTFEGTLEERSLPSVSAEGTLPFSIIDLWQNAQNYAPDAIHGWGTDSGSQTTSVGGYETTTTWTKTLVPVISPGVTDLTGDITTTVSTTSTAAIGYSMTSTSTMHAHLVETYSGDGLTTFEWSLSTTSSTTSSQVATPTSEETWTRTLTTSYTLSQDGAFYSVDEPWGDYTLTAEGSDSHIHANSANAGDDTFDMTESNEWTLEASGGMGPSGPAGPYSLTYQHDDSEHDSDLGEDDESYTYEDSNTMTLSLEGTGVGGTPTNYTLSASGIVSQETTFKLSGYEETSGGWTSEATFSGSVDTYYSVTDDNGDYEVTTTTDTTNTLSSTWYDPASGAGSFFASDSQSHCLTGTSGSPWLFDGLPFGVLPLHPPTQPTPPTITVPSKPPVTPADAYYNWLAARYNAGLIVWPFKGEPWTTFADTIGGPPQMVYTVKWTNPSVKPFLGRPAGIPWNYTGIVVIPYSNTATSGYCWQFYQFGIRRDVGLCQ